ncbi:MAG: hypothetical protein AB1645_04775 [Bacillota bacterium]
MKCPVCGSRQTGLLGPGEFYCWRCFVEFAVGENRVEVYEVGEDGTLVLVGHVPAAAGPGSGLGVVSGVGSSAGRADRLGEAHRISSGR